MKTKKIFHLKKSLIIILIVLGAFKVSANDTIQLVSHTLPTQLNVGKWLEFTATYSSTNLSDTLKLYGTGKNNLGDLTNIIGPNPKIFPTQAIVDSVYQENGKLYTKFKIGVVFHPSMLPLNGGKINNWILSACNGSAVCSQDTLQIFPRSVADSLLPTGSFPTDQILKTFERRKYDLNEFFSNPLHQDTIWTAKGKTIDTNYIYHISCDTIRDTIITYDTNWYQSSREPYLVDTKVCHPKDTSNCKIIKAYDLDAYYWDFGMIENTHYPTTITCDTTIETIYDTNYHLTSTKIDTSTVIQITPYISIKEKHEKDTTYQKNKIFGFNIDTTICHPIYIDSCESFSMLDTFVNVWIININEYVIYDTTWHYDTIKFYVYDTSHINNFSIEKELNYYLTFWQSPSNFDGSYFNITEDTLEVFADEYASPGDNGYNLLIFIANDSGGIYQLIQIGYQEYLIAYLNQVSFETEAAPGDQWESRFNYGDIIQPVQDTIIIDGIPYWAERINIKSWIYKNQWLKASNPDNPDSVWVNRAILKGTVPKSMLKSSKISHVIGAQYCRDGNCIPREEYVLTITEDGATTIEPLDQSIQENAVFVYPNPVKSIININGSEESNIIIVNVYGQIVFNQILSLPCKIPIDNWSKGIYFLRICNEKEIKTFNIIKD